DINGDGDANDPGEGLIDEWVVEVSGPEVNGQFPLSNNGTWDWLGLNSGDIYTVSELQQPGYQVTNTTVDGVSKGAVLFTFTTILTAAPPSSASTTSRLAARSWPTRSR
ncbi:hypothetical protein, partial [Candidatus Amarobacter glycogenicus]|uniref:hypothetical protein n=1 Tax=Candidatus Amarobacter glycogenicus TaxID=3140699 RepID=UPI002A11D66C|nr:hypothetical protein [Dehalococcoidia bacterium]